MSCPICRKPAATRYRPFCSKRCADVDLGKWFGEEYAVPSDDPEDLDAAHETPEGILGTDPQKPR